jgi:hypothetical protein
MSYDEENEKWKGYYSIECDQIYYSNCFSRFEEKSSNTLGSFFLLRNAHNIYFIELIGEQKRGKLSTLIHGKILYLFDDSFKERMLYKRSTFIDLDKNVHPFTQFSVIVGFIAAVKSQVSAAIDFTVESNSAADRVRDLPKNIKTALQGQDNVDITTTAAYESQMNDPKDLQTPNKEIYFVDLKYSAHTVTAISDKDGNRLDKIKPDDQK